MVLSNQLSSGEFSAYQKKSLSLKMFQSAIKLKSSLESGFLMDASAAVAIFGIKN
jgi:hypothetical protein